MLVLAGKVYSCLKLKTRFLLLLQNQNFDRVICIWCDRFAAALVNRPLWVMNVVPVDKPDTLSVVFDRGLIGVYHDWCESLNTYPRTYDLLHSSSYLGDITQR